MAAPVVLAAESAARPLGATTSAEVLSLSKDLRVRLIAGRDLVLEVKPWPGESRSSVARRLAGTEVRADLLKASLAAPDARTDDGYYRVPLHLLGPGYRAVVLRNVFPGDALDGPDWVHVARKSALPIFDEGLWQVAAWFTGDGSHFEEIESVNGLNSPELSAGQVVRIPGNLLDPALAPGPTSDDGSLVYGSDTDGPYAAYRLKPGEALYSSVVVRYTGRTSPDDVDTLARTIAARSGIRDLTDIPVAWMVKIPRDVLEPEFLPPSDPRRKAYEREAAAMAEELAAHPPPTARKGLDGVVVILDPGHGGRDPGTMGHGVREHESVFDVASRLKRVLETTTKAQVFLTLDDPETGPEITATDAIRPNTRRSVLTTPPFLAKDVGETPIAVNLRWYLANSLYRRFVMHGTDPDRVVFVSLHADARHPSLRGVMVYVPGAQYRQGTMGSSSTVYRRFREVREQPHISFTRRERVRSEAVSRKLASRIVKEFARADLPVQPYQPVRERVIRGHHVWLPAVLRGNEVPAKVLVEMVNLNNADDASLLAHASDRERLAQALAAGLEDYFGTGTRRRKPAAVAARGGRLR